MNACPTCDHPREVGEPCAECGRRRAAAWQRANREHRAAYMREYRKRKARERWTS